MLMHVVNNQTNTILDVERYGFFVPLWWSGHWGLRVNLWNSSGLFRWSMRTKSSWETCSGSIASWTFSPPSATNCQTTSQHSRCVRTLRTHRTPRLLSVPLNFLSFTAGYHHPGCAAVLGRNLLRHNELALSQSVRSLQSYSKTVLPNDARAGVSSAVSALLSFRDFCLSSCVAATKGSWKLLLQDRQVRRHWRRGQHHLFLRFNSIASCSLQNHAVVSVFNYYLSVT